MPDRTAQDLVQFIRRNNGVLATRRKDGEFKKLRDDEAALIEGIVRDAFEGF